MKIDFAEVRKCLKSFDFKTLFREHLGWDNHQAQLDIPVDGRTVRLTALAQKRGFVAFVCPSIPDRPTRLKLDHQVTKSAREHFIIYADKDSGQQVWQWVRREPGKPMASRDHRFDVSQSGDPLIQRLNQIAVSLDEEETLTVVDVAGRARAAFDVDRVTKRFYDRFKTEHTAFLKLIKGIKSNTDLQWYTSVMLNRMMFVYFIQKKGFLDGDTDYLRNRLKRVQQLKGKDKFLSFYRYFLLRLFHEGLGKSPDERRLDPEMERLLGEVPFLNGGFFEVHQIEEQNPDIDIPDEAFEKLFDFFDEYSWHLDERPLRADNEINPDVLGYIYEKYINQKAFGAYYTRTEITEYLCERTIHRLILDAVNTPECVSEVPGLKARRYASVADLLLDLDAALCHRLLNEVLPGLKLLDPACGSGAFLVAAMKTLIDLYSAIVGKIKFLNDRGLSNWLAETERKHRSIGYFIKKSIITDNLFGVDIMEEATEIARLRLFLALVASAATVDDLEPLPNIDFNILPGNSLIGLMHVDDVEFKKHNAQGNLFRKSYKEIVAEKNRLIDIYRHATYAEDLRGLRNDIEGKKQEAKDTLDEILLTEFERLGIRFEQATWDPKKNDEGKPVKRPLKLEDITRLRPFHWGYEFDQVLNERGGFDAIITNPPWEIFKPNAKEFFEDYSDLVTKKKMTIHDFEKEQTKLCRDKDVCSAWLEYLSSYPHVSAYYRSAPQYRNQISIVNGKKAGSDINLYKLFLEQCFNLLRDGGQCGIVIPSGIYTDLGAKQLRTMLFEQAQVTGLFCIENRKEVFENVHRSFKFVVLTFAKGGKTKSFPAAFMRHDVAELDRFPAQGAIDISVDLVKRLSPDSLSVMEFKNDLDVRIAEKMLRFPLLGDDVPGAWKLSLAREFDMTNDSHLFKTAPGRGRLPLYEGKMIWQFDHRFAEPRYWVDEKEGRAAILGREEDKGQLLDYQAYRLGFRDIASNTNERTMVSSVIPPTFHGNKIPTVRIFDENEDRFIADDEQLFLCAAWNSFLIDYLIRMKVTTTLNFFYVYQLPIPRLTAKDAAFGPIVERAARLICTTPEFDDLAKEVGLKSHKQGATDPAERARLRAELDGLIAHLYGLTEEEFAYILTTFPLVADPVKVAAHNAYRDVARGRVK